MLKPLDRDRVRDYKKRFIKENTLAWHSNLKFFFFFFSCPFLSTESSIINPEKHPVSSVTNVLTIPSAASRWNTNFV